MVLHCYYLIVETNIYVVKTLSIYIMKILMLGWEFPPFFAGGVGMVCYEIAKEISTRHNNLFIEYVMPIGPKNKHFSNNFNINSTFVSIEEIKLISKKLGIETNNFNLTKIQSNISFYDSFSSYEKRLELLKFNYLFGENINLSLTRNKFNLYGSNLLEEIYIFSQKVYEKYKNFDFDIIHAHDWTTILAGIRLKKETGKPFILHVHITEFDKNAGNYGDPRIIEIEKLGFNNADKIICVSEFTKNRLISNYGINENKITIIHNGGISELKAEIKQKNNKKEKIVLFTGRITQQKGVEYFIRTAKKVLQYYKNVKFVIAGTGDQLNSMIELSKELGIEEKIFFHGFYNRDEADMLFSKADVFVMPSVSEPFGIVPLEAVAKGTPTIISKQSGVSEVLNNCFKIDFWDINKMSEKIISLLKYESLNDEMRILANKEYSYLLWNEPVNKMIKLYNSVIQKN